jgi:UDP-GlcNAc:undecaprenyl-phosphate GlcNAc-1-phosphate transferase
VVDIVTVLAQRIHGGMNWFKATKNHIHHRLLDLGFPHYESVVLIYSVQALFVASGVLLRYASDALIVVVYLTYVVAVFAALLGAKRAGWRVGSQGVSGIGRALAVVRGHHLCRRLALGTLAVGVPVFVLAEGMFVSVVPRDFGVMSLVLGAVLVVELLFRRSVNSITVRGIVYATATFVVYLSVHYGSGPFSDWSLADVLYFAGIALAVGLVLRCAREDSFRTTPMDYLMVFVLIMLGVLPHDLFGETAATEILMKGIILLYASELFLHEVKWRWNSLSLGTVAALGVLAYRGLGG